MTSPALSETKIVQYLLDHPEFFERHAELLGNIKLFDVHGQKAISLQERQAFLLREKIKQHEQRMLDMIRYGNENLTTSNRLHKWVLSMLQCRDLTQLPHLCCTSLQENFFIPQIGIRLWSAKDSYQEQAFAQAVSSSFMTTMGQIKSPYVGINNCPEATKWLTNAEYAASIALLPLFTNQKNTNTKNFGMLIFASPDSQRFTTHMGTDFLSKIAEVASAALWPLIELTDKPDTENPIESNIVQLDVND
jgi:uncharacterized protein YigA (DUF484 family)